MANYKIPIVSKVIIDDSETINDLQNYLDWIQPNSKWLMFKVYEQLNETLKPYCFNNKKKWSNGEKDIVKRYLTDLFNPLCMADVSVKTGRAPFAIYMVYILLMWEATRTDKKRILLKRVIKSAIRYDHAQWDK